MYQQPAYQYQPQQPPQQPYQQYQQQQQPLYNQQMAQMGGGAPLPPGAGNGNL